LFIEYFPMQVRLRRFGWCSTMVPEYFWLQRLETIVSFNYSANVIFAIHLVC